MTARPFPAVTGGCRCSSIRYRLLTSPLFCVACHCADCQKATGSAFALHATIETYNISIISDKKPSLKTLAQDPSKPQEVMRHTLCPQCGTVLWGNDNPWGYPVSDVRIGTLDFPGIMEPDVHSFVEKKLGWIDLPKDARTSQAQFDYREMWPKNSLKRLEICLDRFEKAKKSIIPQGGNAVEKKVAEPISDKDGSPGDRDGEKTPTATGDGEEVEDDEAFEERFRETERALQERLAKLSMKLVGDK